MNAYWEQLVAYRERANQFRPVDPAELREEIKRLSLQGLTFLDIAQALRLSAQAVRQLLEGWA